MRAIYHLRMRDWITQNNLSLILMGFFFLVSLLIFFVGRRQVKEAHYLRDQLKLLRSFYGEGNLAFRMTHEIGNPLSFIRGAVNELLRKTDDEVIKQDLAQILLNVEHIARLVHDARDYIYQNQGIDEEELDLKEVVDDVLLFNRQRLEVHGIELRLRNVDGIALVGNRAQLEQLLVDLLNSSIEEVENLNEKWIEISAKHTEHHVRICFTNSGNGPSLDIEKKINGWFFNSGRNGTVHFENGPHTSYVLDLPQPQDSV
jgi:signal transduction histidine kinase